jgi:hypothetical protein
MFSKYIGTLSSCESKFEYLTKNYSNLSYKYFSMTIPPLLFDEVTIWDDEGGYPPVEELF